MPIRSSQSYYLHLAIPGWQGRVDEHDDVSLRDALTHATVLTLTPAQVITALTNYVNQATITAQILWQTVPAARVRAPLASAPVRTPLRALGVPLRPVQEARRAARATRAGRRKRPAPDGAPGDPVGSGNRPVY